MSILSGRTVLTYDVQRHGRTDVSSHYADISYGYGRVVQFLHRLCQRDNGLLYSPECIPKETFTWTRAVCFLGEADFRRSLQCFAFLSGDPLIYLTNLWNTWLTVHGHIGLEVFFFLPTAVTSLCYRWESWSPLSSEDVMIRARDFILLVAKETCRIFDAVISV